MNQQFILKARLTQDTNPWRLLSVASTASVQFPKAEVPLKANNAWNGEMHPAQGWSLKVQSKSPFTVCSLRMTSLPGPLKPIFQDDVSKPIDVMVTWTSSRTYCCSPGQEGTTIEMLKFPAVGVSKRAGVTTQGFSQKLQGPQAVRHSQPAVSDRFDNGELQQTSWQCVQPVG